MTFNEPMGFLEKGGHIDYMLKTADEALGYFATVGSEFSLRGRFDQVLTFL